MGHDPVRNGCSQKLLEAAKLAASQNDEVGVLSKNVRQLDSTDELSKEKPGTHMLLSSCQYLPLGTTVDYVDKKLHVLWEGLGYSCELGNACLAKLTERVKLPFNVVACRR